MASSAEPALGTPQRRSLAARRGSQSPLAPSPGAFGTPRSGRSQGSERTPGTERSTAASSRTGTLLSGSPESAFDSAAGTATRAPKPVAVRKRAVLEGGFLLQPVVLDTVSAEGGEFVSLRASDRRWRAFLKAFAQQRVNPFRGSTLLGAMRRGALNARPRAEENSEADADPAARNRAELGLKPIGLSRRKTRRNLEEAMAVASPVVNVTVRTVSGSWQYRALFPSRKDDAPTMEATEDNFKRLFAEFQAEGQGRHGTPPTRTPAPYKLRRRKSGSIAVVRPGPANPGDSPLPPARRQKSLGPKGLPRPPRPARPERRTAYFGKAQEGEALAYAQASPRTARRALREKAAATAAKGAKRARRADSNRGGPGDAEEGEDERTVRAVSSSPA